MWDLRSGKCIMLMDGHLKGVVAVDFAPSGWVGNCNKWLEI